MMPSSLLKNKKLLIFGTGAVGGYYGGMLVRAGYDVTFIARGRSYEVLKQNGLTLISDGKKETLPVKVFNSSKGLGYFDYILICVKAFDTRSAAEAIKQNVGNNTTVFSFQNGVENEEVLVSVLGAGKVIGGLAFVASRLVQPGVVDQFGYNGALVGELDKKRSQRLLDLEEIFQSSGIACLISDDIMADRWNKLVWNASFNPISVLTGKTVDKILQDEELYKLTKNIMTEVKNVAVAHGFNVRGDAVEFNLERSKRFEGFKTSMLQDFERKRPIEIEELIGVVIRKAREVNIPVPNIEGVYNKLKQKVALRV